MDGGIGLNLLYTKTFDTMGLPSALIHNIGASFYGLVPSPTTTPLGIIDLPVTIENCKNFRTELLTFEVTYLLKAYHVIQGRS